MNPNICNNCGGDYEYRHGRWICRACGAYKPEELSNEEATLLYTAYQKLRLAEFAEAEKEFDDILQKYPQDPNAYWGRLMSKYGIKYEQDFDGRMIPTCYATSIESLLSAQDYQKAIQYADNENKTYYQQQAEYMERVRKEWLEKAKKENPYDIFICYKDSDLANGIDRTQDSIAAQDLYIHLTNKGYRVFYSRESLKDKIGEKYEPYIFNALSTAKVMIVYGSKPEYITSTWLKNEWTRYEKRIQKGEKKPNSLLVACDGFSPSELPTALSAMQCINAAQKSFYSDIDQLVEKILLGSTTTEKHKKKSKFTAIAVFSLALAAIGGFLAWKSSDALKTDECDHVIVNIAEVPATCTKDGLTEGQYCSVCRKVLVKQATIPAAHKPSSDANCTNEQYCTVCGYQIQAAFGHTPGAEATCTVAQKCEVCNAELHAALGHTPDEWTTVADATTTEDGLKIQKCSVCGDTLAEETIHATGSSGLSFESNGDGTYYVKDIGTCTDADIVIPAFYNGGAVVGIAGGAFLNCEGLTSVTIGSNVTNLQTEAFKWSDNLKNIFVDPNNESYVSIDGVLFNKAKTELICYPAGKTETSYTIPVSVTNIGASAFSYCENLTTVVIGSGVTEIGSDAFRGCRYLKSVSLGENVTSIGSYAFFDCSGLTSIVLPNRLERIESGAFSGCGRLTEVINHSSLNISKGSWDNGYVASEALEVHTGASKIVNQNGYLFYTSEGTHYLLGYIGDDTDLVLPENYNGENYKINQYAFSYSDRFLSAVIPDSVTDIGNFAFYFCTNLKNVVIGNNVKSIGEAAFDVCSALISVVIPDSVTQIGNSAFSSCSNLTSVVIGENVTSIGNSAFNYCYKLLEVINKSSLNISIGSDREGSVGYYALEIHSGTSKIVDQNGYLFYTHNGIHYLIGYIGNETDLVLPENYNGETYEIYPYAFTEHKHLTSITISNGATGIGNYAFSGCSGLTSVIIGNGVTKIGELAFNGCSSLTSIVIGNGVKSIDSWAFSSCLHLTNIQYTGTISQWRTISKTWAWSDVPATEVICSDGTTPLQ